MLQRKLFSNKISRRNAPSPLSFSSSYNVQSDKELTITPYADKSDANLFEFIQDDNQWTQTKVATEVKTLFKLKHIDGLAKSDFKVSKIKWFVQVDNSSFIFNLIHASGEVLAEGQAIPSIINNNVRYSLTLQKIGRATVTDYMQNLWGNNFDHQAASTFSAGIFHIAKEYTSKVGEIFRNLDGSTLEEKPDSGSNESTLEEKPDSVSNESD